MVFVVVLRRLFGGLRDFDGHHLHARFLFVVLLQFLLGTERRIRYLRARSAVLS